MKKLFIFLLTLVVVRGVIIASPKKTLAACTNVGTACLTFRISHGNRIPGAPDCLCWNNIIIDSPAVITIPGGYSIPLPGVPTLPGPIISRALTFLFPLAGIILFFYLVFGGFQFLTSGGDQKALTSAKEKLTAAIIGFILIFVAYWIMMIVERVLGMKIL